MSHTNSTPNYNLPQYVGSDIINPLTDTNGAYSDIDTALKQIADAVADDTSDIAELKTKVGTDALTTESPNLSGAVNEIYDLLTNTEDGIVKKVTKNTTDIDTLEGDMQTANTAISSIRTELSNAESDISNLQAGLALKADESRVAALQTEVGTSLATLEGEIQQANAQIATKASTERVDNLETTVGTGLTALGTEIEEQATALTLKTATVTATGTIAAQTYQEITQAHGITDTGVKIISGYNIAGDADFNVLGVWIDDTNCHMAVENPDATADNYTITFHVVYQ